RLAFADFLDERGTGSDRDRAEFIRIQIELASLGDEPLEPEPRARWKPLKAREEQLSEQHKAEWEAPFRGPGGPLEAKGGSAHFKRGFVWRVGATTETFIERGAELFDLAPVDTISVLDLIDETLARLVRCPWLARLREVDLGG